MMRKRSFKGGFAAHNILSGMSYLASWLIRQTTQQKFVLALSHPVHGSLRSLKKKATGLP